ncbi:MAG: ABC transporter ATP-binding protein [Dethiobacter sp.]|nr:ABC transporter ATP-binding protein [Dethiobacter sp.]MCL5982871.1 ABC transporter ATP-binding protein [Bacillota bacterium]
MDNRIEVRGLSKAYHGRRLFTDINISVPDRSVFAVRGPNGSGKTTFLLILCGLIPATSGQVDLVLEGRSLTAAERRRQLGLVSTDLYLYDDLSAVENLEFFSAVRGLPFTLARARELLEFVGLQGRGRDYLGTFSSGMKQRLKYACALWHKPHVLILDEPTSHMDEKGAALVEKVIRGQRARGMVLMATNSPEELRYGDQTLSLA